MSEQESPQTEHLEELVSDLRSDYVSEEVAAVEEIQETPKVGREMRTFRLPRWARIAALSLAGTILVVLVVTLISQQVAGPPIPEIANEPIPLDDEPAPPALESAPEPTSAFPVEAPTQAAEPLPTADNTLPTIEETLPETTPIPLPTPPVPSLP
ncbi:MAG: hypothetical protein ACE5E7_11480 [Anaerolineae bacterium]